MQSTKPSTLARLAGMSPFTRARLELLADSNVADELLQQDEQRRLKRRAVLVQTLTAAPKTHEKTITAAAAVYRQAQTRHATAAAELRSATDAMLKAQGAVYAAEHSLVRDLNLAERELLADADPRLADAIFYMGEQAELVRTAPMQHIEHDRRPGHERGKFVNETFVTGNATTCTALGEHIARLRGLQLAAVSAAEVEVKLNTAFVAAERLLAPFELRAPRLVDGEVQRPPRWGTAVAEVAERG